MTERKRFEADLAHQATHDSLTGLPNRALLLDHLELEMARAEREHRLVALLFLDLDRFKQVNDTLGHDAGDELLAQAARRISGVVRPADTVARMGGDEFVILCGDVEDQDHATAVAQRVAAAIEHRPFDIGGAELAISASIGIALSSGGGAPRSHPARRRRGHVPGQGPGPGPPGDLRREHAHAARRTAWSCPRSWPTASSTARSWSASSPASTSRPGGSSCVEALARWDHPDPRPDGCPTSSSAWPRRPASSWVWACVC